MDLIFSTVCVYVENINKIIISREESEKKIWREKKCAFSIIISVSVSSELSQLWRREGLAQTKREAIIIDKKMSLLFG